MAEVAHAVCVAEEEDAAEFRASSVQVQRRKRRVDAHVCAFGGPVYQLSRAASGEGTECERLDARSGSICPLSLCPSRRAGLINHCCRMSACVLGITSVPVQTEASRGAEVRCGVGGCERAASRRCVRARGQ